MNTKRIKEIQTETRYPNSISVQQALLKVWNECEQEQLHKNAVSVSLLSEFAEFILHNANWSESYSGKPWYSEKLEKNVTSNELAELFLNSL